MQYRKLTDLKKLEDNPRTIKDKEFQSLCNSIKDNPKFFEARPLILSNRTGDLVIIAGNQRYEAAKTLKLKDVPTYLMEGITEEKEREITIRDNTQQGAWDFDLLANAWDDLPLVDWGVDLPADWGDLLPENNQSMVPDKDSNILVRLSFHPGLWLGKREEIMGILDKMTATYECTVKVEE